MKVTKNPVSPPDEPPFTPAELSTYLGVPLGTLADWRYRTRRDGVAVGPGFVKLGTKLVRYPRAAVAEWMTASTALGETRSTRA